MNMYITSPAALAPTPTLEPRQLWDPASFASASPSATACANFSMPANGRIVINESYTVTWSSPVTYLPACGDSPGFLANGTIPVADSHDRFYASVVPLTFVVAGCTFVAWFLFIVLFLLPGSYVGFTRRNPIQPWKPFTFNVFRYISERPRAGSSRPWLQKVAAFLVVLALTTVTADTFKYAEEQYVDGYLNAETLRSKVTFSNEVKIIRVISDLFLWLAQIQTLIRLFPRHKEKLIIKWVGFMLITLDIVFSCINSFVVNNSYQRPVQFSDAISALSYTFQLSINLLYAAWVLYYALTKRKYAFYHQLMPSISIIALFSILSILIPVVFFLVDIIDVWVSTWGDYFRWLGSAASSIVVWEWVERIEALEADEKRDGILGQEVFEEDEADNRTISSRTSIDDDDGHGYSSDTLVVSKQSKSPRLRKWGGWSPNIRMPRKRRRVGDDSRVKEKDEAAVAPAPRQSHRVSVRTGQAELAYPQRAASPPDRKQTTSTGSTVYAVHYHPVTQTPPAVLNNAEEARSQPEQQRQDGDDLAIGGEEEEATAAEDSVEPLNKPHQAGRARWSFAANPFRRSRKSPPIEIKNALTSQQEPDRGSLDRSGRPALIIGRLNALSGRRNTDASHEQPPQEQQQAPARTGTASTSRSSPQEPTVIAAPPRGQAWSPETQTHSPLGQQGTPESLNGSVQRLASAGGGLRPSPGIATVSDARTPTPAKRLEGSQSAAYDFGNTPPPAGTNMAGSASASTSPNSRGPGQMRDPPDGGS